MEDLFRPVMHTPCPGPRQSQGLPRQLANIASPLIASLQALYNWHPETPNAQPGTHSLHKARTNGVACGILALEEAHPQMRLLKGLPLRHVVWSMGL